MSNPEGRPFCPRCSNARHLQHECPKAAAPDNDAEFLRSLATYPLKQETRDRIIAIAERISSRDDGLRVGDDESLATLLFVCSPFGPTRMALEKPWQEIDPLTRADWLCFAAAVRAKLRERAALAQGSDRHDRP